MVGSLWGILYVVDSNAISQCYNYSIFVKNNTLHQSMFEYLMQSVYMQSKDFATTYIMIVYAAPTYEIICIALHWTL